MSNKYITYILLFIISLLLFYNNNFKNLYKSLTSRQSFKYRGKKEIKNSKEIVLTFITSSNCPYCNEKELPKIIDDIKVEIQEKATELNLNFAVLGVSNNKDVDKGIKHLKKFGFFDELIVGNNWSNIGALNYVYDKIKGPATIPQILITKREYQISEVKTGLHRIGLISEKQVLRRVGLDQIKNWYKSGMPLPTNL